MSMKPGEIVIQTHESVRGLQTFDPEAMLDRQHYRQMSMEERHIRMRSLSPAPNQLYIRSRSRSRCNLSSGEDISPYPSTSVSRGRSPAPSKSGSVRDHMRDLSRSGSIRDLSRGRSPAGNVLMPDMYSSRESLRTREKSPLARKLEVEGIKNVIPKKSKRSASKSRNRDSGFSDEWNEPMKNEQRTQKRTPKPPRSPRSSQTAVTTSNQLAVGTSTCNMTAKEVRQQDWREYKQSPEIQRRKKEQKVHQDTRKSLDEMRVQRRSPPSSRYEIKSAVDEAKTLPLQNFSTPKKNFNYGSCLDQPIPPMMKPNNYVEVNTDDFNIVIKDFSPIRINRVGDRLFSCKVETEEMKNGTVKRRSNNVNVKLTVEKDVPKQLVFGDNDQAALSYRQVINYVRFSAGTPPQLWKQLIQNFQKFSN